MVHNAIEYGMMQALGEGFELLRAPKELDFSLAQVARLWGQGSVVRSWLLELLQEAFRDSPELQDIAPYVEDTGEGRWAVMEAVERSVPLASIALALQARFRSRQEESFSAKVVAALRKQFGGHKTRRK
jgi:6-phosphogluconate dehydrogenase